MKTKIVIFGISGDLSRRKLLPALKNIVANSEHDIEIIGVSRRDIDILEILHSSIGDDSLDSITSVFKMNLSEPGDYAELKTKLNLQAEDQAMMYLSVPPGSATRIATFIGEAGLNTDNVKILFEKPFGLDLESAQDMVNETNKHFKEGQVYRIDHYMAKEIAREIIRLRSDADNHHHHWSNRAVKSVEVVAHETLGVEGRGEFYEQTGAIRDVIQGHLMQLLSLVLMDIPADNDIKMLPVYRQKALESLIPAKREDVVKSQYDGYLDEIQSAHSTTETYAKITLESSSDRWQGVPLILETGKKMPEKRTYIKINYKDGNEDFFEEGKIKFEDNLKDAYEHVIIDAIEGRRSIFTTSGEILASWRALKATEYSELL